jgi:hypothetical protein
MSISITPETDNEKNLLLDLKSKTTDSDWLDTMRKLAALGTKHQKTYEEQIDDYLKKEAAKKASHIVLGHPLLPPGVIVTSSGLPLIHHEHVMVSHGYFLDPHNGVIYPHPGVFFH